MERKTPLEKLIGLPDPLGRVLGMATEEKSPKPTPKEIAQGRKVIRGQVSKLDEEQLMGWEEISPAAQEWARQMGLPTEYVEVPYEELPENLQERVRRWGSHYLREFA